MYPVAARGRTATRGRPLLLENLVAYWPLDALSGTRNDAHTNGLHLTDENSVSSGAGITYAAAADYDMTIDQWLWRAHADSAAVNFASSFSIVAWTYPTAFTGGPDSPAYYRMIVSFNYGSGFNGGYKIQTTAAGQLYLVLGGNSNQGWSWHVDAPYCTLNEWQMVAWTFDYATGDVACGLNGNLATTVNPNPEFFKPASSGVFSIGGWVEGAVHIFDGRIGPVAMWNRTLTLSEIGWLYNGGQGRAYETLA